MLKRLFAAMLAMLMLLCCVPAVPACAEEDVSLYTGGVVMRGFAKGTDVRAAAQNLIDVAYIQCNVPYFVLGETTHWTLGIEGGVEPYSIKLVLYQQDFDASGYYYGQDTLNIGNDRSFSYTFRKAGRYFWKITVTDKSGQYLVFESRVMQTSTKSEEKNPLTVSGKVNQIVSELITDSMSDYTRALVLHDWLIYNANYDYTYTNYDADGVLLYGTGVCESYARAYRMLCTAAGVECMVVTGTGNGGGHAWNLIKLDGSWYHVDCTWDDPGTGGNECHDYFCLTDEQMSKDHEWNLKDGNETNGMIVPGADGGDFSENESDGSDADFTFENFTEYTRKFDAFIATHVQDRVTAYYTGSKDTVWDEFGAWVQKRYDDHYYDYSKPYNVWTYRRHGRYYSVDIDWRSPQRYVRIEEISCTISIDESHEITPAAVSPEGAVIEWISSDPSVAKVDRNGVVTGISGGVATITACVSGGQSDKVEVTVLPAYQPDFGLTVSASGSSVTVAWNAIPGVTHYRVMRRHGGRVTELITTSDLSASFRSSKLPSSALQQIYIIAERRVGSRIDASYTSSPFTYGSTRVTYNMYIPDTIETIGDRTFYGATGLTGVSIPGSVVSIGANAFAGCTSLTVVRIPASVTSIGSGAFTGTPLNAVVVPEGSYAERHFSSQYPDVIILHQ